MNTLKMIVAVGVMLTILSGVAMAQSQAIDLGARYHTENSAFPKLPFANGDLSYGLGYEIHDENGLLQLICGYTPEFKNHRDIDYGITPEGNLLFTDGLFQGGVGILSTYTSGGTSGSKWMALYWQGVLGLNIPLGKQFSFQANAYYVFEEWNKLGDFRFEDIEFGGYLSYKF